jgi:hypothetical protein
MLFANLLLQGQLVLLLIIHWLSDEDARTDTLEQFQQTTLTG